jgi:multidrug efflux pump subunit AcrB
MKITRFFVENRKAANLALILTVVAGLFSVTGLPRQDSPNVDFDILTIATFYPGASPEDVEINVTDPVEDELEKLDGIEQMTSFSIEGMSMIFVEVDPDSDDKPQVKDDIRNAVDRVKELPEAVEDRPLVEEMKSTDFPILEVAIIGDEAREPELRKIAKALEDEIKAVGKVGAIEKIGYRKREVKILADLEKMDRATVSFPEILGAIRSRNVKSSGGTLESFVDERKIVTLAEFDELEDVRDVIIRSNFSGKHVTVSDVATVQDGFKRRGIISRTNGRNSINLVVKRRGTTDVIKLSRKIDGILKKYENLYKDRGIEIIKVVDFTYYTQSLLNIVSNNAMIGFVLVCLALFVFLNLHTAFWVAVGIPLSILLAYIFFPFVGLTTNQIALITIILVLGMLVDDAIVVAENITRHQEAGMDPKEAAVVGTREMFKPVFATVLTTMLCFSPILFMTGILGKFIWTIPVVVILTLGASLIESVTLLPAHLARRPRGGNGSGNHRFMRVLRDWYGRALSRMLARRWRTIGTFVLASVLIGGFAGWQARFELFPTEDFDLFYIVMETETGTSLEETLKSVRKVEARVAEIPEDLMFGFKTVVGDHRTDEAASDPSLHENWALVTVYLHPSGKRDKRSETIIEELKEKVSGIDDFEKLDIREVQDGPPVGAAITVRLVSDDFDLCEKYERKIKEFLGKTPGIKDLESSNRMGKKEINLKLDHDHMARVGISALDLANTIRVAYDGNVATSIRRDGEEIDFRVSLAEEQRGALGVLKKLQARNNTGRLVDISTLASFKESRSPQSIAHFNGRRSIIITANVDGKVINSGEANEKIRAAFAKEIAAIPNLSLIFGGQEKQTLESMRNFRVAFFCAMLAVYFALVLLLDSYKQPLLILVVVPFGFVGVLVAFYLHGFPMSFVGLIGSLGMMGVVVNDSLVMVTYLNQKRIERGGRMSVADVVEGAQVRLRPVVLTTVTTVLGLLPTVYGWGGTEPFLVPMVLAMSWGLMFATLITLIFVPTLYTFSLTKAERADEGTEVASGRSNAV